ncbi:MAG: MaoC/PaaZ C-terminal domain-containing protein [Anaeromyxobacter sp.]
MTLPAIWPSYARMLLGRRPAVAPPGHRVDGAVLEASDVVPPPAELAAYRAVCGFRGAGALPLTYPHALANPLHLALITGPRFPVRFLGLVHLRNTIQVHRPLPDREPLDLRCAIEGPRDTERGQEYDLVTEVRHDGELAWREVAVLLARAPGAGGGGKKAPPPAAAGAPPAPLARWELPADQGRRYASASGDWNPIHLSGPTARLFGFPRAIVHGMWSLARSVAELGVPEGACTVETAFKLPVLLPGAVTLHATRDGGRTAFALRDGDGVKPHLTGTIQPG